MPTLLGIDVSHYNGALDWPGLKKAGVAFAYIKATQGVHTVDPLFAHNWAEAKAAGVPRSAYHFYEPGEDPVAQADHFLSVARPAPGDIRAVLDVETGGSAALAGRVNQTILRLKSKTGLYPFLYSGASFYHDYLHALTSCPLILAAYSGTLPTPKPQIWQTSESGRLPGFPGRVFDLDTFFGTAAALEAHRYPVFSC